LLENINTISNTYMQYFLKIHMKLKPSLEICNKKFELEYTTTSMVGVHIVVNFFHTTILKLEDNKYTKDK
jgi:hypothetical protein